MKKLVFVLAFIAVGILSGSAQQIFNKGNFVLEAGVGAGNLTWNGDGSFSNENAAAFTVAGEYCILENLIGGNNGSVGIGGVVGIAGKDFTGYKMNNVLVGALGTFHYQFIPNLDTYGTVTFGLNFQKVKGDSYTFNDGYGSVKVSGESESNVAFQPEIHAGARYYFTPNFAAMAEVGYGLSIFQVGIAYKF